MVVVDLEIRKQVDRMFADAVRYGSDVLRNPVTGSTWINGADREQPKKQDAYRGLLARKHFAENGPTDAPPLPLSYAERQELKAGGLSHIVAWYAESLMCRDYDFDGHVAFETYACAVMGSPYAPDFITQNLGLKERFPAHQMAELRPGLVWRSC